MCLLHVFNGCQSDVNTQGVIGRPDIYANGGSWQQAAGVVQGPGAPPNTFDPLAGTQPTQVSVVSVWWMAHSPRAQPASPVSFGQGVSTTSNTQWGGAAAPEFAPLKISAVPPASQQTTTTTQATSGEVNTTLMSQATANSTNAVAGNVAPPRVGVALFSDL